jgi:glutathione synthase/RimK-type ligase-like ATP-grasp enzyme
MFSKQMTRIAIATYVEKLPPGDQALVDALIAQGFHARPAIWSNSQENWQNFHAVVVRSCWDYHLRVKEFLEWIARLERESITVINSPDLIRWNADKIYLKELIAAGIAAPETVFLESGNELDLELLCKARNWETAVVKPRISASAYQTERRNSGVVTGPAIVQQFIAAVATAGEWSLVYLNHKFSHAVIKKPKANDFRVQEEHGGTIEPARPPATALAFAEKVLTHLPFPSIFARVDVVVHDSQILLMELEVIEPELYLETSPGSADQLASLIDSHLAGGAR